MTTFLSVVYGIAFTSFSLALLLALVADMYYFWVYKPKKR